MAKNLRTERKLNKLLSVTGIILIALSLILSGVLSVPAAEESGSLTLRCVFTVGDGVRVLPNDEYSLAKIADVEITKSSLKYTTLKPFKSFDCEWNKLSASELNEKAKALAYYCRKNKCFTGKRATDENGELIFNDLQVGLYLVARTKTHPDNKDFVTNPLLVFIPQNISGKAVYYVVSTPKYSYLSAEDNEQLVDTENLPDDGSLPQTGQLLWPVSWLAVLGCALIIGGSVLARKESSGEK